MLIDSTARHVIQKSFSLITCLDSERFSEQQHFDKLPIDSWGKEVLNRVYMLTILIHFAIVENCSFYELQSWINALCAHWYNQF